MNCKSCIHNDVCERQMMMLHEDSCYNYIYVRGNNYEGFEIHRAVLIPTTMNAFVYTIKNGEIKKRHLDSLPLKQVAYGFQNYNWKDKQYFLTREEAEAYIDKMQMQEKGDRL